jgi:prepilin-type N-terminal cleavage/methylation domain-containing protein
MEMPLVPLPKKLPGFTLVEMSVVIAIIAMITAMGMMVTSSAVEGARRSGTENRLDVIEKALKDFRLQHYRLPCPSTITLVSTDAYYGQEATTGGTASCNTGLSATATNGTVVTKGGVPTRSLNLPDEYMFDAWGRRISYFVDPEAVKTNAFNIIPPDARTCSVVVADATGSSRSDGAVYALVSHGKNGHGAYMSGTTRINSSVTQTDELYNCWCNSSAAASVPASPKFIMRENLSSTTVTSEFDDMVRYKERWQLLSEDDYKKAADFKEYQMAVNYQNSANISLLKRSCHGWVSSNPASGGSTPTIITPDSPGSGACSAGVFSADNNTLFTHCNSITATCQPYSTKGRTIEASSNCTGGNLLNCVATCPQWATYGMAASGNDYIAIPTTPSPYLQVYRAGNTSTSTPHLAPLATPDPATIPTAYTAYGVSTKYGQPTTVFPYGTPPSARPVLVVFSKNADYLFLSDKSTYATMYKRVGDATYKALYEQNPTNIYNGTLQPSTGQPLGVSCDNLYNPLAANCTVIKAAAFSPDGKYFAVAYAYTGNIGAMQVWKINDSGTTPFINDTGAFVNDTGIDTVITTVRSASTNAAAIIGFSPDSHYLVYASGSVSSGNAVSATKLVYVFEIEPNDTFAEIHGNFVGNYPENFTVIPNTTAINLQVPFTPDSQEFMIPVTTATGTDLLTFQKRTPKQFELYIYPIDSTPLTTSPFHSAGVSITGIAVIH